MPLADAWDSGASAWTAKERESYANDLDDARDLITVSVASNRSKADKGPGGSSPCRAGVRTAGSWSSRNGPQDHRGSARSR
ncbi:hypothetical protein ABTY96_42480 [Streptomyces sp. NPDC096057]|uniref:hypothetical protein n=1 Tax=Streptomyces sp. NPDC096057 TaxID=3155543 RepID=UPI0033236B7F